MTIEKRPIAVATLLPVYHGDSLPGFIRSLDSVLAQRLPPNVTSRIYLGVDGPLDHQLGKWVEENKNLFYKVCQSPNNAGLPVILNRMISQLDDEEFIFRMDADDYSMPDRYLQQIEFLLNNPEIGILGTAIVERSQDEGATRIIRYAFDDAAARKSIWWRTPVAHPTVCFSREALSTLGFYPEEIGNEDIAMWFSAVDKGIKFSNLDVPLLEFSIDSSFYSRRGTKKAFREWRIYVYNGFRVFGPSWRVLLPTLRLLFRLSPEWVKVLGYNSGIRNKKDSA